MLTSLAEPDGNASRALLAEAAVCLRGRRVVALTGAGVSTESGIPDYRSPAALERARRPIHGPDFVRSSTLRRRYWARAMAGWERFRLARPSASHVALATLEQRGVVSSLITQNVDRLHHQAGSTQVIELHGALAEVVCLDCGVIEARDAVQARMREHNPAWLDGLSPMAPDGDADLPDDVVERFTPPACVAPGCGGTLKPNVVFFGHNVARPIVDEAYAKIDGAGALLVAGTSLAVFSGYRFLRRAAERQIPIVIVNRGPVRGEEQAAVKIEASTGSTLAALAALLTLLVLLASTPCIACSPPPDAAGGPRSPASGAPASSREATSETPPGPVVPVPETLALVAGQFGLTMQAEGFTWKVLRRNVTRFDWSGRPASGDRELLYSFYVEKLDETSAKLLPQIVGAAAANLSEGEPCRPFEQPAEIVQKLGVDRVVTVCFEPSTFYGKEHHHAVLHGIVHDGALTIVAVLSNEATAIIPLPKIIGAHGKR